MTQEAAKSEAKEPEDFKKPRRKPVDLNKVRAARLEKIGPGPQVRFGETTFQCPPEIPFVVVEAFVHMGTGETTGNGVVVADSMASIVRGLFGERAQEFMDLYPSTDDLASMIEAVLAEYGVTAGESQASEAS